jgi:hypothetical protein
MAHDATLGQMNERLGHIEAVLLALQGQLGGLQNQIGGLARADDLWAQGARMDSWRPWGSCGR